MAVTWTTGETRCHKVEGKPQAQFWCHIITGSGSASQPKPPQPTVLCCKPQRRLLFTRLPRAPHLESTLLHYTPPAEPAAPAWCPHHFAPVDEEDSVPVTGPPSPLCLECGWPVSFIGNPPASAGTEWPPLPGVHRGPSTCDLGRPANPARGLAPSLQMGPRGWRGREGPRRAALQLLQKDGWGCSFATRAPGGTVVGVGVEGSPLSASLAGSPTAGGLAARAELGARHRPHCTVTAGSEEGILAALPGGGKSPGRNRFDCRLFFTVAAILGDTCLRLLGVHFICIFLLFYCCLHLISRVYLNSSHPAAGKQEQSPNSLRRFLTEIRAPG